MFNLLGNAIKFTRIGGVIVSLTADVDFRLEAGRLEIMVTDSGSSIPDENTKAIFNAFMQRRQYADNRSLVVAILRRHNVYCREPESGQAARELLKTEKPNFIFMDLRVPELDGYETTRLIRKNTRFAGIPVVALSASAMTLHGANAVSLFDGYIRKPIVKHDLLETMTRFLAFECQ